MMEAADGVHTARFVRLALISFEEQIHIIRHSHVLIGMHGAGTWSPSFPTVSLSARSFVRWEPVVPHPTGGRLWAIAWGAR